MTSAVLLAVVSGPEIGARIRIPASGALLGHSQDGAAGFHRDVYVSKNHAEVRWIGGGALEVRDLGSTNGTRVNGRRISGWQVVSPGDIVTIGMSDLEVIVLEASPPSGSVLFGGPATADHGGVVAGTVTGGIHVTYREDLSGLGWITETRGVARFLIILGTVLSLAGVAAFAYPIIDAISSFSSTVDANQSCFDRFSTDPDAIRECQDKVGEGFDVTPWIPLGAGLFFMGSVVTIAGVFSVPSSRRVARR
jgi:FHA domain